jgi:hypothetical protein
MAEGVRGTRGRENKKKEGEGKEGRGGAGDPERRSASFYLGAEDACRDAARAQRALEGATEEASSGFPWRHRPLVGG